ncbi:unnamed protein product [Pleuronectes platessa]|uniref:Uncharacterized protein n=1 Tax=Pleuronectes platessa TaxID=8262 RepID=A0A9N7Y6U7_PLEPL|nr:unnamed protein product [Pleuronectes platessa]
MEKENEKVLASGPKGDETAAGENSNYGTELQKGGCRDELEEREEVEKPPPSPFFYSSKQTPPLSPFLAIPRRRPGRVLSHQDVALLFWTSVQYLVASSGEVDVDEAAMSCPQKYTKPKNNNNMTGVGQQCLTVTAGANKVQGES